MTTTNEDFPTQSTDPDLQQATQLSLSIPPEEIDDQVVQDFKVLLRLLIGSAAEGSDEFSRRARLWQAEMNKLDPNRKVIPLENETDIARLRYTLVGLLFDVVDTGYQGLSFLDKVASKALTTCSFILSPLTSSRLWRPVKDQFNAYSDRGESVVNSWMDMGRREEEASRNLVRKQAYEEVINDAIEYLANKPEVTDLVQQQSVGMAGEILGDIRTRSNEYDNLLEKRVRKILGRKPA